MKIKDGEGAEAENSIRTSREGGWRRGGPFASRNPSDVNVSSKEEKWSAINGRKTGTLTESGKYRRETGMKVRSFRSNYLKRGYKIEALYAQSNPKVPI